MIYRYRSVGKDGDLLDERGDFDSLEELERSVRKADRTLLRARRDVLAIAGSWFERRTLPRKTLIELFGHMASLLELGVDFVGSLRSIPDSFDDPLLQRTMRNVVVRVEQGFSLAEAIEQTGVFPSIVVAGLRAGELAGELPAVLRQLERHLEREQALADAATRALYYPVASLAAIGLAAAVIVFFALPELKPIFPKKIPFPTQVLIFLSDSGRALWWSVPALIAAGVYFARRLTPQHRLRLLRTVERMPVAGPLARDIDLTSVLMNLALLLKTGIPILQALQVSEETARLPRLREALRAGRGEVERGLGLADMFIGPDFPPLVPLAVRRSQTLGKLDDCFARLSEVLYAGCDRKLRLAIQLIEPVILVVGGGMLLGLYLAILLPIVQMTRELGGH